MLDISEGLGRRTNADRKRFYNIAFASLCETQAILDMADAPTPLVRDADMLCAHVYKLIQDTGA